METAAAGSHNPYPVTPTGFLIGSYIASILYGLHLTQLYTYFTTYADPIRVKALVIWVFALSTLQMAIIVGTGWKYFIGGISEPSVWGHFLWPLSFQDALIPLMAFTGQMYFGRRAHVVMGRRKFIGIAFTVLPVVTLACGIALAITAWFWARHPYVAAYDWTRTTKTIGIPSQIVAITWMGMSALTDGSITLILLLRLRPYLGASPRIVTRLMYLTLETVLLTHICGAAMCVIFLASDANHRTDKDIFWVLIEIVTELYALSILFTINSRRFIRRSSGDCTTGDTQTKEPPAEGSFLDGFGVSEVERRVEGYQGDTPFGVAIHPLFLRSYQVSNTTSTTNTSTDASASSSQQRRTNGSGGMLPLASNISSPLPSPLGPLTPGMEQTVGFLLSSNSIEEVVEEKEIS